MHDWYGCLCIILQPKSFGNITKTPTFETPRHKNLCQKIGSCSWRRINRNSRRRNKNQPSIRHGWPSSSLRSTTYATERHRSYSRKWLPIYVRCTHSAGTSRMLMVQQGTTKTSRDTWLFNHNADSFSASQRSKSSRWTSWPTTPPYSDTGDKCGFRIRHRNRILGGIRKASSAISRKSSKQKDEKFRAILTRKP